MSEDPFQDTEERKKVFDELKAVQNESDMELLLDRYFPGWLVLSLSDYSRDYQFLKRNWETVCQKIKTSPKKIVLVQHVGFDKDHIVVQGVCEFMTLRGYIVRRVGEFIACSECEKAIPCREVWLHMKAKNLPVPSEWKNRCSRCMG